MPMRQGGRFASRSDASARDLLSQHDGAARIEADQVKGVLAHIYSDGGHCVKSGRAGHGGAPFLTSPRRTLKTVGGGSAAGPSHSRTSGDVRLKSAKWAKADIGQVTFTPDGGALQTTP